MRSLDVSRIARTRWTSHHVTTDSSESRATGSPTPSLSYDHRFPLMSPFHLSRTSSVLLELSTSSLRHPMSYRRHVDVIYVTRTSLLPVLVTPNPLSDFLPLTDWTLFMSLTFTVLTPVCTCIVLTCIYTGLEMGRSPSSIYFATTLVL